MHQINSLPTPRSAPFSMFFIFFSHAEIDARTATSACLLAWGNGYALLKQTMEEKLISRIRETLSSPSIVATSGRIATSWIVTAKQN